MKRTILTLTLLAFGPLTFAQAQTTTPVTSSAVPAAPVASPDMPAPANALPPLLLSAPVGAHMEYTVSNTSTISINQLRFAAQSGKTANSTELAKLNARLESQKKQMAELFSKSANAVTSKLFVRVLPNDAAGNRVLTTTTITNVTLPAPSTSSRRNAPKTVTQTNTVTATQTLSPSGKLVGLKVTTSDPKLQKVYDQLSTEELLSAQGLDGVKFYGLPLALGQPVSQNYTLDVQSVFGNVLGAVGGSDAALKAQPLKMQVATTLLSAAGETRQYEQAYSAQPWSMTVQLGEGKQSSSMRLSTDSLTGQGVSTYRQDGLLVGSEGDQKLRMSMITEIPNSPYQMEMVLDIATKTSVKAK